MNIKEVSEKYSISTDTLRYYERIGVIPPVTRDKNGYRDFSEKDLNWVYFAKVLRQAGVTIERLVDYTNLSKQGGKTLETRKAILADQLEDINKSIEEFEEARDYLKYKLDSFYTHMVEYEKEKLKIENDQNENQ
ncbi:MerR family transcriptional regulator [Carnobacterium sp. CS13]|uniref:MerR family transcriptional regulator n=1 Tax=Carnobacterium sp. CS13 TaxID=2800128 RepID=UPI00191482C5|nr:MerR family transcriptional regulator [Carnobacterium sp. CS13]QQP70101.1 MerR family transcriptional regulator [Carnobacterium sp. CS13]